MLHKHGILSNIWLINASHASNYLPLITSYLKGELKEKENNQHDYLRFAEKNLSGYHVSEFGNATPPEEAHEDSIAIIDFTNAITKYDSCCDAGMLTKSDLLQRCFDNDNIKGIIFNIDSGGGEGAAMRHISETIAQRNKPIISYVSDFACSAAYGIASCTDLIVANSELATVGSIGTYVSVADYTEYFKKMGINLIEVYASDSTEKNMEVREAVKGNTKPLLELANRYNEHFLSMIEENRKEHLKADRSKWGTGKTFFASDALEIGLIDKIDSFSNILNYFV
ncbi:MAG: S49 family peptidase [Fermentimonas sp.]|nr:S49 family peptidase [Fermentimonas sp.]